MTITELVGLAKSAGAPLLRAASFVTGRIRRPVYTTSRAPANVLEFVAPGVSVEYVKNVLGTPFSTEDYELSFQFSDAWIQTVSDIGGRVVKVGIVIPRMTWRTVFPMKPLGFKVGKLKLGEVIKPNQTLYKDFSSKFWCFHAKCYFGFPGNYCSYSFGVISCPRVTPPKYDWDYDKDMLASDPNTILVNWVEVATDEKHLGSFNFWPYL